MKKLSLVLALALTTIFAFANNFDNDVVAASNDRVVTLNYDGFEDVKTSILIQDVDGEILYSQKRATPSQLERMFLINENVGNQFSITIQNDLKIVKADYTIENGRAMLTNSNASFKPVFKQEGNKVKVNFLNLNEEKVSIKLYNEAGVEVFVNYLVEQNVNQAFDLSKVDGEFVTISIAKGLNDERRFTYRVNL